MKTHTSARRKAIRGGFTLMELVVAALLATALLALLWRLMSTYEGLYLRGQGQADESQLARGVLDQMGEDLRGAISDSPVGAGAAGSVRRFGLFGTERAMQIDVLQFPAEVVAGALSSDADRPLAAPAALAAKSPPAALAAKGPLPATRPGSAGLNASGGAEGDDKAAAGRSGGPRSKQAPELRTVQYVFTSPDDSETGLTESTDLSEPFVGLIRRELDWEPADEGDARTRGGSAGGATAAMGGATAAVLPRGGDSARAGGLAGRGRDRSETKVRRSSSTVDPAALDLDELPQDSPTVARFPEVVEMRLRYFDGTGWSSEWNSLQRRSLPVAVEITLRTVPPGTPRTPRREGLPVPGLSGMNRSDTSTADDAARGVSALDVKRPDASQRLQKTQPFDPNSPTSQAAGDQPGGVKTVRPSSARAIEPVTRRMLVYLPGNALRPPDRPSGERYSISERWLAKRAARPAPRTAVRPAAPAPPPRIGPSGTPGTTIFSDQWMRTVP